MASEHSGWGENRFRLVEVFCLDPPSEVLACMQERSADVGHRCTNEGNVQVLDGRSIYVREDREDGAMRGRSPRVGGETNGAVRERGPRVANGAPAAEGTKVAFPAQWNESSGRGNEVQLQSRLRDNLAGRLLCAWQVFFHEEGSLSMLTVVF